MITSAVGKINIRISALTLAFIVMVIELVSSLGVDHCYSDIGCFPLSDEFYHPTHRPFNVRPWHRRRIKTQFELYNRQHPEGFMLRAWNRHNLLMSGFDPTLETKIIIPGWLDNIKRVVWIKRMKDALLWLWHPINVIVIHWRNFTPYTIATANTRVVGAELANLLKFLEHELNYDRSRTHLIGHSLGAHIGGYCGDRLPGLGRITALDPARPFFQHMPKSVRLDRADARFVDAIHSDFTPENAIFLLMSFGMTTPVGHLDFYPNGPPLLQPGCLRDTLLSVRNGIQRGLEHSSLSIAFLETIRYLTACDHQRSHEWFIESITNRQCVFVGVRCNEFEGLINGRCTCDNSKSACAIMGINADQMYANNVHEDLWPVKSAHQTASHPQPPSPAPTSRLNDLQQQLGRPMTKDQVYSRLKQHAHSLRYPAVSPMVDIHPDGDTEDGHTDAYEGLETIAARDAAFVEYLRATMLAPAHQQGMQRRHDWPMNQLQRPPTTLDDQLETRGTNHLFDDLDTALSNQDPFANTQHPPHYQPPVRLLSDLDRDIETWYEDSSRWYLKTHHRPHYCVNQYQVLVFIGPLRTSTGMKHIRANLLISIIGSRGQLLNQRFVPRSAKLDSFTMQPFFIILDGTYSLGAIKSVAIAWEARTDIDPVQATISFQSPLLDNAQALLPPPFKAKHPWLSETLKYDHTDAFKWMPQRYGSLLEPIQRPFLEKFAPATEMSLFRRSSAERRSSSQDTAILAPIKPKFQRDECSSSIGKRNNKKKGLRGQCTTTASRRQDGEDELDGYMQDLLLTTGMAEAKLPIGSSAHELQLEDLEKVATQQLFELAANNIKHHGARDYDVQPSQPIQVLDSNLQQNLHPALRAPIFEEMYNAGDQITAELHNVGIHLDRYPEDSIVVSQVVISPLRATYGKGGKTGKVFCSPHPGYRLQRERTVRLVPNLFGKCHNLHESIRIH